MCYGSPANSLEIARSRLTPEQWSRFEREFDDFCVVQGFPAACEGETRTEAERAQTQANALAYHWARWAFFQGRQMGEYSRCCDTPAFCSSVRRCTAKDIVTGRRVADVYFEKIAIAMMSDEQALASLERWKKHTGESK